MKFWDTIAKMCGVKIDASRWGERPTAFQVGRSAFAGVGGRMDHGYERVDELTGKVRGHAFKVEMRDHSLTATIDGHGFRILETEKAVAVNSDIRIGLIAIERIRPMKGKSGAFDVGAVRAAAESLAQAAQKIAHEKPVVLS